jgi:histidinol-phosphate aminotransferase
MQISRRSFLRTVGLGTAAGTAVTWPLARAASTTHFEPERTTPDHGYIRLDSNENVYGPSRRVLDVIRAAATSANRYPYMRYDELIAKIANRHNVKYEQVLLGCGSTEILRMAAQAFLGPGKKLVQASPTFEALGYYALPTGAEVVAVPLIATFAHDLEGMLGRCAGASALIYLCNPNNPTGSITARKDIESFIGRMPANATLLIDEAYHHYAVPSASYASFLDHPVNDERVIVLRTFSKVYALAGLRLGYAIASPEKVGRMRFFTTLDNVNGMVVSAAMVALDDEPAVADSKKRNADARQEFFNQALARMLRPIDSQTNFVMMDTHHPAAEVIEHFRKFNILIGRRFPAMDTCIRVSLGTPSEMQSFWRAWDMLPYPKMGHH